MSIRNNMEEMDNLALSNTDNINSPTIFSFLLLHLLFPTLTPTGTEPLIRIMYNNTNQDSIPRFPLTSIFLSELFSLNYVLSISSTRNPGSNAIIRFFFSKLSPYFEVQGLAKTEPPLSIYCCSSCALHPPIAQFLLYARL